MTIQPMNSNIIKVTNYIVENYVTSGFTFYPILWASNSISSERTTKAYESFRALFSSNFYSSQPNIFVFVKAITETQTSMYIEINNTE